MHPAPDRDAGPAPELRHETIGDMIQRFCGDET